MRGDIIFGVVLGIGVAIGTVIIVEDNALC